MKKLTIHSFIALLVFSLLFVGCAKEKTLELAENQSVLPKGEDLQRKAKDKILHFIQKVQASKSLISNRDDIPPLSVDEAIWGAEAVLSVYYSNVENRYEKTDFSTSTVLVPVTNGLVLDSDLPTFYQAVWQEMQNHINTITWSDKRLCSIDLELDELTNNQASIQVRTAVGKVSQEVAAPPYFMDGDNWFGGEDAGEGHCDGTNPESNAAKEFTKMLNLHYRADHPLQFPDLPYYGWYAGTFDVTTEYTDAGSYPYLVAAGYGDNYRDYTFFRIWSYYPNFEQNKCIDWETMNFFYDGLVDRVDELEALPILEGRKFISGKVESYGDDTDPLGEFLGHKLKSTLGHPLIIWGYPDPNWGTGGSATALDEVKEKMP